MTTYKKHIQLTPDQIKEAYLAIKRGEGNSRIARRLGITPAHIFGIEERVENYMRSAVTKFGKRYNYVEAVKLIKQELNHQVEESHKEPEHTIDESDRYTRLKASYESFEKEMTRFIIEEVADQVGTVQKENESLKKDLAQAKQIFEESKNQNWVDALRRHFGND